MSSSCLNSPLNSDALKSRSMELNLVFADDFPFGALPTIVGGITEHYFQNHILLYETCF